MCLCVCCLLCSTPSTVAQLRASFYWSTPQSSSSSVDIASASGAPFTSMLTERRTAIYGEWRHITSVRMLSVFGSMIKKPNCVRFSLEIKKCPCDSYCNRNNWDFQSVYFVLSLVSLWCVTIFAQAQTYTGNIRNIINFFSCQTFNHALALLSHPAVVASLSSCVKRGIECWSSSGYRTPSITSISVGGLTIMDSKIFQSPLKPNDGKDCFSFLFPPWLYVSASIQAVLRTTL